MTDQRDRATVFVDADNTLWDTDAVFADAQLALLETVEREAAREAGVSERLAFVRELDQAIAERHHARLRYPPLLLVRAVELALNGARVEDAARKAWRGGASYAVTDDAAGEIEQAFFAALGRAPDLRPGVVTGLATLAERDCSLLIVTEGAKAKVERNADRLDVARFFDRIIEGPKVPGLYRRVLSLTGAPSRAFMVGDQLDRDIAPAREAGIGTIFFPGGFQPRWTPAIEQARPDHVIASFDEIPGIVLEERQTATLDYPVSHVTT